MNEPQVFIESWKALGVTAFLTTALGLFVGRKLTKAKVNKAEEEAEGQGIQNLDKILEINAREIERIEQRFKDQLKPLHQIIANQKLIIEHQKEELERQEIENKKYLAKYGKLV